jgi:signal transduction histidine kinase
MSRELYDSIVSKLATVVPMFAKSIVDSALEKHGFTPSGVNPAQMMMLIRDEIQPRIRKFTRPQAPVIAMGAGIVTTDSDGRVLWIDQMARILLGLPREAADDDLSIVEGIRRIGIGQADSERISPTVSEFFHEPSQRTINIAIAPRFDRDSKPAGCIAIIQDVTLRVALEDEVQRYEEALRTANRELEERNRELVEANRHKTEFLARMSHELRTPLHCIIGYTQLALDRRETMDEESLHESLTTTVTCAYDLLGIINEVLDLSSVDTGHMVISVDDVDPGQVVAECAAAARALVDGKDISIDIDIPDQVITMRTDRRRLKQVLLNLLGNAVKFTSAGRVSAGVRNTPEDVLFTVVDTGIGIAPEQFDRIFESFYQVDGSTTRLHGGIGLGLALVRHVVSILGGRVDVASEVDSGTTFTVALPRQYRGPVERM